MANTVEALQDLARQKALTYHLDPNLFVRQITRESNWNPLAVSRAGAQGLGQFMPGTAREMGLTPQTVLDPEANLDASARYMARMLQATKGDYPNALASYNFGLGNVQSGTPWPAETRDYVRAITGGTPPATTELRALHSTLPPLPRVPSMQTATSPSLRERLYESLASSLNVGLPAPKAWVGEELPDPVEPTTSELLGGGMTMASLMAGGMPVLAKLMPAVFGLRPVQLALQAARSMGLGAAGGEIGEAVAGPVGRDIGETIGSKVGFGLPGLAAGVPAALSQGPAQFAREVGRGALRTAGRLGLEAAGGEIGEAVNGTEGRDVGRTLGELAGNNLIVPTLPPAIASRISGIPIPPVGPLEGTAVLTKDGLAQPVFHGSPVYFPDYDREFFKRGRYALEGVWSTSQPQEASKAYAGATSPGRTRKTLAQAEQALRGNLKRQAQLLAPFSAHERQEIASGPLSYDRVQELAGVPAARERALAEMKAKGERGWSLPESVEIRQRNLEQLSGHKWEERELREALAALKQGTEVASGATNMGSSPHLRPQYLTSKNLFDMDKRTGPAEIDALKAAVRQRMDRAPSHNQTQQRGRGFVTALENQPGPLSNEQTYRLARRHYGDEGAQRLVKEAGFDGFTHIGREVGHRVFITDPEQVMPAFDPRLTEAQAEQARRMILHKELKAVRADNERLLNKAGTLVEDDDPRHYADLPGLTKQKKLDQQVQGYVSEGHPRDLAPNEVPFFYEHNTGVHPLLDKFIAGVEKSYVKYHRTGELTPLVHKSNSAGSGEASTDYPDLVDEIAQQVRDAGREGTPLSHRQVLQYIDRALTPAAQQEWKNGKIDWRKDIR